MFKKGVKHTPEHREKIRAALLARVPAPNLGRSGFCECGCGERTRIATCTDQAAGNVRGHPLRFISGHNSRVREHAKREQASNWQGGRFVHRSGYVKVLVGREHPMSDLNGYVREHRLVMAQHLGRMLDRREVVHHVNGDKSDNRIENLSLFSSNVEHMNTQHRRQPPTA